MTIALPEWKLYSLEMDGAGKKIGEHFQSHGYDICGFAETNTPYADYSYILGNGIPYFKQSMLVYKELAGIIMEEEK